MDGGGDVSRVEAGSIPLVGGVTHRFITRLSRTDARNSVEDCLFGRGFYSDVRTG